MSKRINTIKAEVANRELQAYCYKQAVHNKVPPQQLAIELNIPLHRVYYNIRCVTKTSLKDQLEVILEFNKDLLSSKWVAWGLSADKWFREKFAVLEGRTLEQRKVLKDLVAYTNGKDTISYYTFNWEDEDTDDDS